MDDMAYTREAASSCVRGWKTKVKLLVMPGKKVRLVLGLPPTAGGSWRHHSKSVYGSPLYVRHIYIALGQTGSYLA